MKNQNENVNAFVSFLFNKIPDFKNIPEAVSHKNQISL